MKQPLKSVLLCIFHPIKFPALFCSSLTQWLFQGEIAISTSRCTSMIAVTPIPSAQPQKKMLFAFWLIAFYLSICPQTPAHSASREYAHQPLEFDFFGEIQVLTERLVLSFPDVSFHFCASFTDTLFQIITPQFSQDVGDCELILYFTHLFIDINLYSHNHSCTNSK